MPYEKVVAYNEVLYDITIPNTFTLVFDLLDNVDKNEIYALKAARGHVLDGYIISYNADFQIKKQNISRVSNAIELVLKTEKYTCPCADWIFKTWVKSSADNPSILRLFLTSL